MAVIVSTKDLTPKDIEHMTPSVREWVYNGLDVCVTNEVFDDMYKELNEEGEIAAAKRSTYALEKQLLVCTMQMELNGALVDPVARARVALSVKKDLDRVQHNYEFLQKEIWGRTWSPSSHVQVKEFFYKVLNLKPIKKRNTNGIFAPTVDTGALLKLAENPYAAIFCSHIALIRDLTKQLAFLQKPLARDNRLRCRFNVTGTTTGRLASSADDFGEGTNLQNIDKRLKTIFVAPKGRKLANFDLSQADSRHVGATAYHFLDCHDYLDACESGDLHTTVSKMAWPDLDWTEGKSHWRSVADRIYFGRLSYRDFSKKLGHGSNYMSTALTAAKNAHISLKMAEDFQHRYFKAFPEIPEIHKYVEDRIKKDGYLITIHNRYRQFFGRSSDKAVIREAMAFFGQSATADAMNKALIRLYSLGLPINFWLQVHDSILFDYPEEMEDEILPLAQEALTVTTHIGKDFRPFAVPVEGEVGWNYKTYDEKKNPNGMIKWTVNRPDNRTRLEM